MERLIAKMDGRRRILMIGAVSLWLELVLPRDAASGNLRHTRLPVTLARSAECHISTRRDGKSRAQALIASAE